MKERIFALKKGTEVADRFDGVTVPFTVPEGLAEILRTSGASEGFIQNMARAEATADSIDKVAIGNAVAVYNQAHALNVQKHVKGAANEAESTVDSLRELARTHKYGQVRVRGTPGATAKPRATQVQSALGEDFLASLTPEQRKLYEERMAALAPKPKTEAAPAAATVPAKKK